MWYGLTNKLTFPRYSKSTCVQAIPIQTPLQAPEILETLPQKGAFLLESQGSSDPSLAAYTFLGAEPYRVVIAYRDQIEIEEQGLVVKRTGDALELLAQYLKETERSHDPSLPPFQTGAVGFLSYDMGRRFEVLPALAKDELQTPDVYFAFYDVILSIRKVDGSVQLLMAPQPGCEEQTRLKADGWLKRIQCLNFRDAVISDSMSAIASLPVENRNGLTRAETSQEANVGSTGIRSTFTRDAYLQAVGRAIDYIYAGDVFQVNLSQRFAAAWTLPAIELYKKVRRLNPAPFGAYLDCGKFAVVSSSPERFLKLECRGASLHLETRPIKGTRPRGREAMEDARLRESLQKSEKDQAELAMIVDLMRNDLGKICEYGSVVVPDRRRVEPYATVFHTVATIEGQLRANCGLPEILRATFPGGSITGAPKVRAMEIIEELEPVRRGVYCGSIGYIGCTQTADLNIAIRTFVVKDGTAYFHAGGGVVADSDPLAEYEETLHKVRALFEALGERG